MLSGLTSFASGHQLQVVDDDNSQIMFHLEFTAFASKLCNRDTRRIVNDQVRLTDDSGTFDQLAPVFVSKITGSDGLGIYAGFQREQTVYQLLL